MNEQDKADLIVWLSEHDYSVRSVSDNVGPITTAMLQEIDGKIVKTTSTTFVVEKTKIFENS